MKQKFGLLFTASIINTVITFCLTMMSLIFIDESVIPLIIFASILGFSAYMIYFACDINRALDKKRLVIFYTILSFLIFPISGIISLVGCIETYSQKSNPVNAPPVVNNNVKNNINTNIVNTHSVSKEARKIDTLTKLGTVFIVLSGIIFATSDQLFDYSGVIKPLFIAFLVVLFRVLSIFFEKKVKIENTSKLYYILSYILLVCTVISLFYFKTFGEFFSFEYLKYFCIAIICLSISYSLIKIQIKYNVNIFKEFSFAFVIFTIFFTLKQFDLDSIYYVLVFGLISFILYYFREKLDYSILNINDILYGLLLLIFTVLYLDSYSLSLLYIFVGVLLLFTLKYRINTNDRFGWLDRYLFPILISILASETIILASNDCSSDSLFKTANIFNFRSIIVAIMLIFNFLFIRGKDKETVISGLISTYVIAIICILALLNVQYSLVSLFTSILLFISTSRVLKCSEKKFYKVFSYIIQTLSVILLSVSFINFYKLNNVVVTNDVILLLFLSFEAILFMFERKILDDLKLTKVLYNFILLGLSFFSIIFLNNHNIAFNIVMILIIIIFRFISKYEEKNKYTYDFVLIMTVFMHLSVMFVNYVSILVSSLILLIALLVAAYYINSNKYIPYLTLVFAYIPYLTAIKQLDLLDSFYLILSRLPLFVLTFVITRKILELKKNEKFGLEIVGLGVVFISYMFNGSTNLALFTGLLSLLMIFLGFKFEKYNSLFYVGLGATILNILVELVKFWDTLSLFAYLFIGGLIILGYVTYIALRKDKKVKEKKQEKEELIDGSLNFMNILLIAGMIICLIINNINIGKKMDKIELENFNQKLSSVGIDSSKIRYDINKYSNDLYILEGYHFDIYDFVRTYNYSYDNNIDDLYVHYVKSLSKRNYNDLDTFSYQGKPKTNYRIGNVNIKFESDYLNSLDVYQSTIREYSSIDVHYSEYDSPNMKLCFTNPNNDFVKVRYFDYYNSGYEDTFNDNGCIDVRKGETDFEIYVVPNVLDNPIDIN